MARRQASKGSEGTEQIETILLLLEKPLALNFLNLRAIQVRALSGLLGASLQDETPGAEVIEEFSLARFAAVKSVL